MGENDERNRLLWDRWASLHAETAMYDMTAFKAGDTSLKAIEREALPDVVGKTLLHLQCHLGQDTLSWAREGAIVTGLDFSAEAISRAQALADELAIPARFVCAPVEEPAPIAGERFDIVFTSYGVLSWLADLAPWAATIARHLKSGGRFVMVEFHPVAWMLSDDGESFAYGYFNDGSPEQILHQASYAGAPHEPLESKEWAHGLGGVMNALIEAGLVIGSLREYPWSPYNCFPFLEETAPGRFEVRGQGGKLPLTFSLTAELP